MATMRAVVLQGCGKFYSHSNVTLALWEAKPTTPSTTLPHHPPPPPSPTTLSHHPLPPPSPSLLNLCLLTWPIYIYIYIYMVPPPPPPPTTDPGIVFPACPGRGWKTSKIPTIPTQVSDFWKLEREPQNPKIQNSSSFQNSENPKIPTQVSDFWKLEREPQNPKIQNSSSFQKSKPWGGIFRFLDLRKLERELDSWILRLPLEFPKIQTLGWVFWSPKFLELPKIQKSKNSNPSFGFLETRAGASKSKIRAHLGVDFLDFWIVGNSRNFGFLDFEAPARVSQNPKLGLEFLDFWIFGNSRNFGFLDFGAPARVSKNPKLGLGFLGFWNFGNWGFGKIFFWGSTRFRV